MPEIEDEASGPWEASAGQVGAPAPPPWSTPAPPPPTGEASGESDHDGGHHHRDERFPPHRDVYGVQSFGHGEDSYSTQTPRRGRRSSYRYGYSYVPGSTRAYRRATYRQQRAALLGRPHAISIALLVAGAVTVGLAYPVFALGALAAAFRARRRFTQSLRIAPARTWLIYAIVFAVLGITSITLLAVFGSQPSSTDGPPLVSKTVPLGQPATVLADVTDLTDRFVPVTVTVSSVSPAVAPDGLNDNTAVSLRICAGAHPVDPGLVTSELYLEPTTGDPLTSSQVSANLISSTIPAGRCLSGTAYYNVPVGTTLEAAQYGIVQTITWPLAHAASG